MNDDIRYLLDELKKAREELLKVTRGEFTQICSYCGFEAPAPNGWDELQKHVQECKAHPLYRVRCERDRAREENAELRRVLELGCQNELTVCPLMSERDSLKTELADARGRLAEFKGVVNDIDRCGECWKSSWCPQCEYTLREAIVKLFDAQRAIKKVGEGK